MSLRKELSAVSQSLLSLSPQPATTDTATPSSLASAPASIAALTSNQTPFSSPALSSSSTEYPQLARYVDATTTLDCLRNSKDVIKMLQRVIDQCVGPILVQCWRTQTMKPRLDALMKLAVPFLCTPLMTSMLNIGESMMNSSKTLDRVKKCIIHIFTFFINTELSIFNNGDGCGSDEARVELCVILLGSKCSQYSPLALTLREYAFTLFRGLSLHALGVAALNDDVTEAIAVLISHMGLLVLGDHPPSRHTATTDAFSTDVVGIQMGVLRSLLVPHITDYFSWLDTHRKPFVRMCRAAEVIECTHPTLRKSLQDEEFSSPYDILRKFESKYKRHLMRMPLPLQMFQREDIQQAMKDIVRENFVLNGAPHHGSSLVEAMVACLEKSFNDLERRGASYQKSKLGDDGKAARTVQPKIVPERDKLSTTYDEIVSESSHCTLAVDGADKQCVESVPNQNNRGDVHLAKVAHPFVEFVDLLSRFLLIASSRTLASGDAFFIVNDLFGGDGLTLSSNSQRLSTNKENDIRIHISPLRIIVECNQCYDLFSTAEISQCRDKKHMVPIISFEIKVITEFKFSDVLRQFLDMVSPASLSHSMNEVNSSSDSEKIIAAKFRHSLFSYLFILMSSDPEKICQRSITIIPVMKKSE